MKFLRLLAGVLAQGQKAQCVLSQRRAGQERQHLLRRHLRCLLLLCGRQRQGVMNVRREAEGARFMTFLY